MSRFNRAQNIWVLFNHWLMTLACWLNARIIGLSVWYFWTCTKRLFANFTQLNFPALTCMLVSSWTRRSRLNLSCNTSLKMTKNSFELARLTEQSWLSAMKLKLKQIFDRIITDVFTKCLGRKTKTKMKTFWQAYVEFFVIYIIFYSSHQRWRFIT